MPSDETVVQMQHPIAAACNNPHDTLFYPISPITSCVSNEECKRGNYGGFVYV